MLISTAVSQWPRPGLHEFFDGLRDLGVRIALQTSVPEPRVRVILRMLAHEGRVPDWAAGLPCVPWRGRYKDVRDALQVYPDSDPARVLLVDDTPDVVAPGQQGQWIPIVSFQGPFGEDDGELARVLAVARERVLGN